MKNFLKKIVANILELEAKLVLKKYKPTIVAITGSVGKTSGKDAIYTVLSKFFFVRKSEKSYNSEIGVPLTVLGIPNAWSSPSKWAKNIISGLMLIIRNRPYPKWLVLEVGAGKPGDIKRIAKWVKPDYVIITRIGDIPVHVEFFESKEHLLEEKASLIPALKQGGTLILNHDDEKVRALSSRTKNKTVTYGLDKEATLSASNEHSFLYGENKEHPQGISFKLDYDGNSLPVFLENCIGKSHVYAALAALSVAYAAGANMLEAAAAMAKYETPPGRLKVIEGAAGSILIDDSYNASPNATHFALETLKSIPAQGRKIAVLGDMLELGKHTEEAHKEVGALASDIVDLLVVVGVRSRLIIEGAKEKGFSEKKITFCENAYEAGRVVRGMLKEGDVVLIKGSQGVRMERTVLALMAHPERKKELLVRQEKEWLDKP